LGETVIVKDRGALCFTEERMGGLRVRHRAGYAICTLVFGLLVVAVPALAQAEDAQVAFAANIEKCKAHLAVSAELYAKGDRTAALHASHPIQEIGNKVIGPASKISAELGDKVRAALRRPSADLKGGSSPPQYDQVVREAGAALDEAVERVVPKERRTSLTFRARVLADLLLGTATEYQEAYNAGKITQMVEYQDAYAFFKRAQALHRDLAPALRAKDPALARELDGQLAALARALPGLTPPAQPMSADRIQAAAAALAKSLASASD
jgi:hypothetical protein